MAAGRIATIVALAGAGFLLGRALSPDDSTTVTTTLSRPAKTVVARPAIQAPAAAAALPALVVSKQNFKPLSTQTSAKRSVDKFVAAANTGTQKSTATAKTETQQKTKTSTQLQPPPFNPHSP